MLKLVIATITSTIALAAAAQTAQPGATTPSITPSQTTPVTPSQTPAVTPSETPTTTAPGAPVIGSQAPVTGGLSPCENMIGLERDNCLKSRPAGPGATQAPAPSGAAK
jgi:hypothetical protein